MIFNAISAASGGGGAKIATGSYVGTGTYGSSNPCSLTFDFAPMFLWIYATGSTNSASYGFSVLIYNLNGDIKTVQPVSAYPTTYTRNCGFGYTSSGTLYGKRSEDGKTISWYNTYEGTSGANYMFNVKGYNYHYLAIG